MLRHPHFDTGPPGAATYSSAYMGWFVRRRKVPCGSVLKASELKQFDELRPHNPMLYSLLDHDLFYRHDAWEHSPEYAQPVSNLETWCRIQDANFTEPKETAQERKDKYNELWAAFGSLQPNTAATWHEEVARILWKDADVVTVCAPPGAGKSLLALMIVRRLIELEKQGATDDDGCRGALGRPRADLTKSIQVVPSSSNAAALSRFLKSGTPRPELIKGAEHALLSVDETLNPSMENVEHLVVPSSAAEKVLEFGVFKAVIIDEAHSEDAQTLNCIVKALIGAAAPSPTEHHSMKRDSLRTDKVIILYGVRCEELRASFERMVHDISSQGSRVLRYKHVEVDGWERNRFPLWKCCMKSAHQLQLEEKPAMAAIVRRLKCDAQTLHRQDSTLLTEAATCEGLKTFPSWLMDRVVEATKGLMAYFVSKAMEFLVEAAHVEKMWKKGEATEAAYIESRTPFRFPTIIVYLPSTGTARDAFKLLRFAHDDNVIHPVIGSSTDAVQPFKFFICGPDQGEDAVLTSPFEEYPYWYERGLGESTNEDPCSRVMKGRVILCVNGSETGLTVDNVGAIVDSGMEWLRSTYSRSGLNDFRFFLTDSELMNQRAGRGGRTRDTVHVSCLGVAASSVCASNNSTVVWKRRAGAMMQTDFVRLVNQIPLSQFPSQKPLNWTVAATEGRVNGSIHEEPPSDPWQLPADNAFWTIKLDPLVHRRLRDFPTLEPTHAKLLRLFVCHGLALHGIVRVALLVIGSTAMMKPSAATRRINVGPCPEMNTLDIFARGITSYLHNGRALQEYEGDTIPLVEFHVQLIKAANWNIASPVPDEKAMKKLQPSGDNFWNPQWLPCGPVKPHQLLRTRMDFNASGDRLPLRPTQRRRLWSVIRMLAFDLMQCGLMVNPCRVGMQELNKYVRSVEEDPLLTQDGRALFSIFNAMHSTRFASIIDSCRAVQTKARGAIHEYYTLEGDEGTKFCKQQKVVRAERGWDLRDEQKWLRYDPTTTTTDRHELPYCVAVSDPVTSLQAAFFANVFGRWRTGQEQHGRKDPIGYLEIELNGSRALYGMRAEMQNEETTKNVARLRHWLRHVLSPYPLPHGNYDEYFDGIAKVIEIWKKTSAQSQAVAPSNPSYRFFDD